MCRAVVRGLNIEYEPIRQGDLPAFLEWDELLAEAANCNLRQSFPANIRCSWQTWPTSFYRAFWFN